MDTSREQTQLRLSIFITFLVGASCVGMGLVLRSQAIAFDGFYSLIDVVLTTGALAVSRLVMSEGSPRFQFGYWHLEPLVVAFNATVLAMTCGYAALTAVQDLLKGGHELAFGLGAMWAALIGIVSIALALYMNRKSRLLRSTLLKLDAHGWMIGGGISIAVLVGYGIAAILHGGPYDSFTRYIDSTVLLVVTLALLPLPLGSLASAMRDVLQLAPDALDHRVRTAMQDVVRDRGYLEFASYVAKMGRMSFIDIHILVSPNMELGSMAEVDEIRADIARRIGGDIRAEWLTIVFTGKKEWL
ncbi:MULTISPECIES: cation diffusion facilitator family transporter [Dyella]|uniref:Cation transporter n=2 Tax=Dyella TaxID=231454 RepID=A0A4V2NLG2_9GAMM|nr:MULTISPECIES: cation transporter [Dyella]TBR35969.1 cation transporter [Dyella terrae]TCI08484.1 cation transporter [Dyella soli]